MLAVQLEEGLNCFWLTDGHWHRITPDNASLDYRITREFESTLEVSGIDLPLVSNRIPCSADIIPLALGAFPGSLGVKQYTKSWVSHVCAQQFGKNESLDIVKSETLWKEGNAGIHNVPAMRQGLAKII